MASLLSGTFLAIVIVTAATTLMGVDIERVSLGNPLRSLDDFVNLVSSQIPQDWSLSLIMVALPFALQLSILAYLDTLMTSLVIDKMTGETTKPNQELAAQSVAHVAVAFVGGIAGAQATIRSVLMVKEGAVWRWAGVLVGVFALIEMLVLQEWIKLIPQAVFAGVLLKVGYDVFDWAPVRFYLIQLLKKNGIERQAGIPFVQTSEILIILGTTLVTVMWDLNVAVASFTALFYLNNLLLNPNKPINDLQYETEGFSDEE
jgi:SulP family sulfate permease